MCSKNEARIGLSESCLLQPLVHGRDSNFWASRVPSPSHRSGPRVVQKGVTDETIKSGTANPRATPQRDPPRRWNKLPMGNVADNAGALPL